MSDPPTFNLLDEPWIVVLGDDNTMRQVSIGQVFEQAHRLRRIAGELPTQDAAVLRLLLAILHRALPVEGDDEAVRAIWASWWKDGRLPDAVGSYLDDWHDRFDLLDGQHPFFQVADLHTASGKTSGVEKLIADLPAGHKFFTNRAGAGATSLSLPEAARWLVHCQAFDPSGIKSGAAGDERVTGGKGYPIGIGWTGNLGLVVLEGETLAQTLLLNLVLTTPSPADDLPAWETEGWSAATTGQDSPRGPAQAMTWQIRRIRLHHDTDRVIDALISNGDAVRLRNQHLVETMSGWRKSEAQEKKHGEALAYMPRTHQPGRAVWRGLDALLASDPVEGTGRRSEALSAANVAWLAALRHAGHITADEVITIHTTGAEYGSNNSVIGTVVSDRMALRAEVLDSQDLQDRAVRAAKVAELAARAVGNLAANLAVAAGRDDAAERARAVEQAYQRLDPVFRDWALRLSSTDPETHEARWSAMARQVALALGQQMYATASPTAIRGRVVTDRNGKQTRIDAGQAHQWFVGRVWRDIPDLIEQTAAQTEENADE